VLRNGQLGGRPQRWLGPRTASRDESLATAQLGNEPPRSIPLRIAHSFAWIVERVHELLGRKDSLVSTDSVFLSNAFQRLDNGKARRELGWQPRPIAETVRDAVAWYAQHAKLASV
jgi:dihydroflavonol-4-reductase